MAKEREKIIRKVPKLGGHTKPALISQGWDEVEAGAVVHTFEQNIEDIANVKVEDRAYSPTSSMNKYVGDWRSVKPVYNSNICIDCQNCWVYCPDSSIISREQRMQGVDYNHCKGCGICADVCPTNPKSLVMFEEVTTIEEAISKWPQKEKRAKK